MSIGILTDSTCDLSQEIIEKYKIEVIPLSVHFGEEEFQDCFKWRFFSLSFKKCSSSLQIGRLHFFI